jgi:PKD repeat protein
MSRCSLIIIIFFLFIGLCFISSSGVILGNKPSMINNSEAVLYVGGVEPGNYSTIQSAIDDASDGDTVFVYDESSPYYENVRVHKRINLIGENKNTTFINSIESPCPVVNIVSDNVIVSGFTTSGGYVGIGIYGNNNVIRRNKIVFNRYGIETGTDANNNVITDNIIVHNIKVGIWEGCRDSYNTITWNVISGNGDPEFKEGGIYKHLCGGYCHHNDFDLNWGYNAFTEHSYWGVWDNGSKGNYWDNWDNNSDVYIIKGTVEDQIDRHPSETPYFDFPIVRIDEFSYEADPNKPIHFYSYVNKPISSLSFLWEYGDGNTSNGKDPVHSYSKSGIYHINLTITDDKGVSDTDKSIAYIGLPPDKPTIKGPTKGRLGVWHEYSINATDPDSDYLHYYIDWGDGLDNYIGPYLTVEIVNISHGWMRYEGNYTIRVKAIDETLRESEWSFLNVQMTPKNRMSVNSLFYWFLDRFPILQKMLLYLIK